MRKEETGRIGIKKEIKKSSHAFSRHHAGGDNVIALSLIAFSLIFIVIYWRRKRSHKSLSRNKLPATEDGHSRVRSRIRPRSRRRQASDKQIHFLKSLIDDQNFFRSKPVHFDEWLQQQSSEGSISIRVASKLIQSLRSENEAFKNEFDQQKKKLDVGSFRSEIYVSDLRTFYFCEQAAYYSTHQFPNQNLFDLSMGRKIHRAYSDEAHRDSTRPANVASFIMEQEPDIIKVEWIPNAVESTIRHSQLPLSGRPDGILHFRDGTKAVIELKTVAQLPAEPRTADLNQVDIYALLAEKKMSVCDESFVLYSERSTQRLALHKRKRILTEYDLIQIINKIERAAQSKEQLRASRSEEKCASCGYRSICRYRS
jgi:CRISPR-associated protein Cas4